MKRRLLLIVCGLAITMSQASAQDNTLTAAVTQSGQIEADQADTWQFELQNGEIFTVLVEGRDGFDPQIEITSSAGSTLFTNDDARYPGNLNALAEALTAPAADVYNVIVSGFGGAAGSYDITYLPGYGDLLANESFDAAADWQPTASEVSAEQAEGRLSMRAEGADISSVIPTAIELPETYYMRFEVSDASSQTWQIGMALRYQADGSHYRMLLRQDGRWRLDWVTDDATETLLDWGTHPAIVPGSTQFTLSVLERPGGVAFFYNNQLISSVAVPEEVSGGEAGIVIATGSSEDEVTAEVDNLIITRPIMIGSTPIFPTQLMGNESSSIGQELNRRGLIPPNGEQVLSIDQASSNFSGPGVSRLPLARGSSFDNFVMSASLTPSVNGDDPGGCGLTFRETGENQYTLAYIDNSGAYGLSQRRGDTFERGLYGQVEASTEAPYTLLIVAMGTRIDYFINNSHVGSITSPTVAGGIGYGVINFGAVSTTCDFSRIWLWTWQ